MALSTSRFALFLTITAFGTLPTLLHGQTSNPQAGGLVSCSTCVPPPFFATPEERRRHLLLTVTAPLNGSGRKQTGQGVTPAPLSNRADSSDDGQPTQLAPIVAAPPVRGQSLSGSRGEIRAREIRAMWVVRDSLSTPAQVIHAVRLAHKWGFNTLFVQVRGRGDAFYQPTVEPRAEALANQANDFDPLALAVREGHRLGIGVHAWMNTFLVWHLGRRPWASRHIMNRHPDWLVVDKEGRTSRTAADCEGMFLNPARPEVREYLQSVFLDVATRYNVDGIHLDYVRYPCERFSFGDYDMAAFRAALLPHVSPLHAAYADSKLRAGSRLAWYYCFPDQWRAWRREQVTATVRGIADKVHSLRPGVTVSAAVFPNYEIAARDKGQAWHEWLQADLLDAAAPMCYSQSTQTVAAQVRDAVSNSAGKPIIAGIGAWRISPASAIAKARAYRQMGAAGINLFSYDDITREGRNEGYLAQVSRALFTSNFAAGQHKAVAVAVTARRKPKQAETATKTNHTRVNVAVGSKKTTYQGERHEATRISISR